MLSRCAVVALRGFCLVSPVPWRSKGVYPGDVPSGVDTVKSQRAKRVLCSVMSGETGPPGVSSPLGGRQHDYYYSGYFVARAARVLFLPDSLVMVGHAVLYSLRRMIRPLTLSLGRATV